MSKASINKIKIKSAFSGIDRAQLAKKIKSSRNTIDQVATGLLIVSAARARDIEKATAGKVPASVLRPDIFNTV
jgi:DNA-binding transcriptional regulator YdaS (Cro superfamily)